MITTKASHRDDASSYFSKFQKSSQRTFEKIVFEKFEETIIRNVESLLAKINKK